MPHDSVLCERSVDVRQGVTHQSGLPGPQVPLLYLEPFELTFDVHFQGREHGLVLVGQVLESAGVTVTATPLLTWASAPSSLATVPPWAADSSGTWWKIHQSPTGGHRCGGPCGQLWKSRRVRSPSWWCQYWKMEQP